MSREKWENESNFALSIYKEIATRWIEELSRSVECQWQKYLYGSRFYRESIGQIESFSMDWKCDKVYWEKKKEGLDRSESIEDLSRSCRAWRKWVFQREEKHIEMNATSKLLKHRSNQHVKLSKTSLNKKMKNIHDPKHTHTHTHTKSLTNFIVQKQVITV